jgi:hypothetical protein
LPPFTFKPKAVATALKVTPAQATRASRSISPEQAKEPSPPDLGWSPAETSALEVFTEQTRFSRFRVPSAFRVISALPASSLYWSFRGCCRAVSSSFFIFFFFSSSSFHSFSFFFFFFFFFPTSFLVGYFLSHDHRKWKVTSSASWGKKRKELTKQVMGGFEKRGKYEKLPLLH